MTVDDLVEALTTDWLPVIDHRTKAAGLSTREAAEVCRGLAAELRNRAEAFEEEADADEHLSQG